MTIEADQKGARRGLVIPILLGLVAAAYLGFRTVTLSNAGSSVRAAQQALANEDTERVRALLDWVLYFEPNHRDASVMVAASYVAEGRYSDALSHFERVPEDELEPSELDVKAASLIGDHQWDRAEELLAGKCQGEDMDQRVVDRLARLYLAQLRRDEAIELLDRYVAVSGDRDALMNLLELLAATQSPDAYLGGLDKAHNARPGQKSVRIGLARGYALNGQIDLARTLFEAIPPEHADDPDVQLAAAAFYVGTAETNQAARLLDQVKGHADEDHRFWFLQARLAEDAGDVSTASAHLDRAMRLSVPREAYLQTAARLARRRGKRDEAAAIAAAAAQLARRRQKLMALFSQVDVRRPRKDLFAEISAIVKDLGYERQAKLWQELAAKAPQEP